MLVIRLARKGRRNHPTYRIVVQENSQAPTAAPKEVVGSYDPHRKERADQIILDAERCQYWISVGAQPSNTVHNLLVEMGVIKADKKRSVQPKKKPGAEGEEAAAEAKPADAATDAPEEKKEDTPKEESPAEDKAEEKAEEKTAG